MSVLYGWNVPFNRISAVSEEVKVRYSGGYTPEFSRSLAEGYADAVNSARANLMLTLLLR